MVGLRPRRGMSGPSVLRSRSAAHRWAGTHPDLAPTVHAHDRDSRWALLPRSFHRDANSVSSRTVARDHRAGCGGRPSGGEVGGDKGAAAAAGTSSLRVRRTVVRVRSGGRGTLTQPGDSASRSGLAASWSDRPHDRRGQPCMVDGTPFPNATPGVRATHVGTTERSAACPGVHCDKVLSCHCDSVRSASAVLCSRSSGV
jgi:hypothetical protein